MTPLQVLVGFLGVTAGSLIVTGMLIRGWARFTVGFTFLMAFSIVVDSMILGWPSRFLTWDFWLFKQIVFDVLEVAAAIEIAYRACLGFPGAARTTRTVLFVILVATFVAVMVVPGDHGVGPAALLTGLRPRFGLGIAWLFTATAYVIRFYDLPRHPMHLEIAVGMAINLSVFSLFVDRMSTIDMAFASAEPWRTLVPAADTLICWWWVREAWRHAPELAKNQRAVLAQLQPWRVR